MEEAQNSQAEDTPKLEVIDVLAIKEQPDDLGTFSADEPIRKKKLTSAVWETFTPLSSSGLRDGIVDSAKCNVCHKTFSTRHGTSSMMRHAKRHVEIAANLSNGKRGRKQHGNSADKKSSVGQLRKDLLQVHGLSGSHIENEGSGSSKRQKLRVLHAAILEWMIYDRQDPAILSSEKFADIFTSISIRPNFPTIDTITKALERKYHASFSRVMDYINRSAVGRVTFSCDTWSGVVGKGYMAIYLHWVNAEWESKTIQIGLERYPDIGNACFFSDLLYHVLQNQWGIANRLVCGVLPMSDETSVGMGFLREKIKVLVGIDSISPHWNVPCLGHLIHTSMLAALQDVKHEILKLRSLLSLLQSAMESQEHFAMRTTAMGLPHVPDGQEIPAVDTASDWQSTVCMILDSVKVKDTINTMYADVSNGMNLFLHEEIDWELLVWVATFVRKCIQMATCQSDQKHISLSTSLNVSKAIIGLCESTAASVAEKSNDLCHKVQSVCLKVKLSLETYHNEHTSPYLALAKILDPRFSNESDDKAEKKEFLREMTRKNVFHALPNHQDDENSEVHDTSSAYSTFEKLLDIGEGMPDYAIDGDEVDRFFDATLIRDKRSDPFLWWKSNETRYPNIAKLARDVLSIPATAIPSGNIFSQCTTSRSSYTHISKHEGAKLSKYAELERAWQVERNQCGRKRRRDSFDCSDGGAISQPSPGANGGSNSTANTKGSKITYEEGI